MSSLHRAGAPIALALLYGPLSGACAAPIEDAASSSAQALDLAATPEAGPVCEESVGKLPLELGWLQAPTRMSHTSVTRGLVYLGVHNPSADYVDVELRVRVSQPRYADEPLKTMTLPPRSSRRVAVDLDELAPDRKQLIVSGRLDVLARVRTRGSSRQVNVASAPVYFHDDAVTGATMLYGEDVLRLKYRAGDLGRLIDPRLVDLSTTLEVVQVAPPSALTRTTNATGALR